MRNLVEKIRKRIGYPVQFKYDYSLKSENIGFEEGFEIIKQKYKNRVAIGSVNNVEKKCIDTVSSELQNLGMDLKKLRISINDYAEFLSAAEYKKRYPAYYPDNFFEKTLEHYLCYFLLGLTKDDTFIDIASEHSPVSEIFSRLTGCHSYSQDLMYEPGIHGNRIGSDAASLPVPEHFFNAAIATCSLEHFENDSDIHFMNEMGRVLKKGGKIIIAPLYMFIHEACQTDPLYSIPGKVNFDKDAIIYCAKDWGNRHARFYSPDSLFRRIVEPQKNLKFCIYLLENPEEVDPSVYCRFILEGTRI